MATGSRCVCQTLRGRNCQRSSPGSGTPPPASLPPDSWTAGHHPRGIAWQQAGSRRAADAGGGATAGGHSRDQGAQHAFRLHSKVPRDLMCDWAWRPTLADDTPEAAVVAAPAGVARAAVDHVMIPNVGVRRLVHQREHVVALRGLRHAQALAVPAALRPALKAGAHHCSRPYHEQQARHEPTPRHARRAGDSRTGKQLPQGFA